MKKSTHFLAAGILLMTLTLIGCKKDDDGGLSVEQEQLAALTGTWIAESANDGNDRSTDYADFTITFNSGMTYITAGGPSLLPFPEAAKFTFGENVKSDLFLEPEGANLGYTYNITTDGKLTLTSKLTYSGPGFENTRVSSVSGDWRFVFTKQ